MRAGLRRLALLGALGAWCATAGAGPWPHYELDARLDPGAQSLAVRARITLPERPADGALEFVLGADFEILAATPAVTRVTLDSDAAAFVGINSAGASAPAARYRVRLPAGATRIDLEYRGTLARAPASSPEEYARSFAETPGIVAGDGVYLAGSTLWYPQLAGAERYALLGFALAADAPPGWHLVAPGDGVSRGADGRARWASQSAVDEISLAGGPLVAYSRQVGAIEAQVYLRQDDPALATKYLDATSRYLRMYADLIGPYPWGKFALVENFWETGYGMPSYTLLGPQVIRFPFILTSSYPHEILHNWWGNSVYVDYASGNWCEGLTAYLADHLMAEVEGRGVEYRRDTLKRYRDFTGASRDFPLREFRARHSAATEAVGYGKTLMGFHMLRRRLGDEAFRRALADFYAGQRGRRAAFADLRPAFERAGGGDLSRFFEEWTGRTGAADLAVTDATVAARDGGFVVSGVLRQRQEGAFDVAVPVVVTTAAGPVTATVASREAATPFSIATTAQPEALAVDPGFDVLRVLDPRETAPSLGQLFGASEAVAVLPTNDAAETAAWRSLADAWQGPSNRLTVVTDRELSELPADRPAWLLGRGNRLAARHFAAGDAAQGLAVSADGIRIGTDTRPFAAHSHVLTRRHPLDAALALGWITADPPEAIPGLARKLPHYGKYSWLAFAGGEPANVGKGEWAPSDSPLLVGLGRDGHPVAPPALPKRAALAEPPSAFAPERLMAHVAYLAAPEREGRGFGSAGLDAAADYIAREFAAAGLDPGGDEGGWFQAFTARGGRDGRERPLRNVIGVLHGANPAFDGQAAVLGAHYDHLGFGWPGARAGNEGKLHPGADDNASGVAVLIEVAKALAAAPAPPRTLVFVAFSGEEAGRLGSRHYVAHPLPAPAAGIFGIVNMDTVGRLGDQPLSVLATASAREWPFVFSGISAVTGVPTRSIPGAAESSDQQSFIEAGIPGVQLFTSATLDYHQPGDTPDKVDGPGLARVAVVAAEAIGYLASTGKRLTATNAGGGAPGGSEASAPNTAARRVSLGAVPDFAFPGPGLRLDSVVPGSPADKAGLRAGDVLTHFGGAEVSGLSGFNELLKGREPGERVDLRWQRAGAPGAATVELVAR